jgi:hypothetical protein
MKKIILHLLLCAAFPTYNLSGAQETFQTYSLYEEQADEEKKDRQTAEGLPPHAIETIIEAIKDIEAQRDILLFLKKNFKEFCLAQAKSDAGCPSKKEDYCFPIQNPLREVLAAASYKKSRQSSLSPRDKDLAMYHLEKAIEENSYDRALFAINSGANPQEYSSYWSSGKYWSEEPPPFGTPAYPLLLVATIIEICSTNLIVLLAKNCCPTLIEHVANELEIRKDIVDYSEKLAALRALIHTI